MIPQVVARDRIIIALDLDPEPCLGLAGKLLGHARWVKVGMTLFYKAGPPVVEQLRAMGFDVFLDLKLHDIPHQVSGAARSAGSLGVGMLTVHASGGSAMVEAAVRGADEGARAAGCAPPAVIAVTVLTSMDDSTLADVGITRSAADQVALLAAVAAAGGAAGVVCSPQEARAMRDALGERALVVTPGVRPDWAGSDDQARVSTPSSALHSGASHLVVGRPVTADPDPVGAFERIVAEIEGVSE